MQHISLEVQGHGTGEGFLLHYPIIEGMVEQAENSSSPHLFSLEIHSWKHGGGFHIQDII